ncbi:Papain-like cysteine peptidase superfamily [Sesbania bispinosa]|nr:Papain-like cysteine peptidase superfamily [Sesbania bispinosa]
MANYEEGNDDTHSFQWDSPNRDSDNDRTQPQSKNQNQDRYDFIEGLRKLIAMSDSMINCVKSVKKRLEGMDNRIDALHGEIGDVHNKINTILNFTKNVENDFDGRDWPIHTTLKMSTSTKSPIDELPKGVSTVIFDVSDEEEDVKGQKEKVSDISDKQGYVYGEMDKGPTKGPSVSNEKGKSTVQHGQGHGDVHSTSFTKSLDIEGNHLNIGIVPRKLFHTPFTASHGKSSKKPKINQNGSFTFLKARTKGISSDGAHKVVPGKQVGNILPKTLLCKFRATADMQLTEIELKVSAYVFAYDKEEEEVLFRVGNQFGRRKDFNSLCPDMVVHEEIITMAAVKGTWVQYQGSCPSVWYCPPSFVVDILSGDTIAEILNKYCEHWMQPFPSLKYVYIPVKDEGGHWFLIVASMDEKIVYHLGSRICVDQNSKITIKKVVKTNFHLKAHNYLA